VAIRNTPARKKIALISGRWYRNAVYTSLAPLVRSLAGYYEVTLVHFGTHEREIQDREMFERVITILMKNHQMDLSPLQDNEFSAAIYPDIGLNAESIYLSNIRLAPIQAVMYGHPTSTWGSKIDYFLGGREVEDAGKAGENYSERLVLIPGMGVYPVYPDEFTVPDVPPQEEPFYVNCGWTAQKVSYPLLDALREVLARAEKMVIFRIFPGRALTDNNGFIPFVKDIHSQLGAEHVQVFPNFSRMQYFTELCRGAISLDSYPFGGFNTVIDALHCRKPMVVWKGDRAFNRFGAATLEIVGLPELIACNRQEYIDLTVRLINDDGFRRAMRERVGAIDLKGSFAKHEDPGYYRKAIDYLIENNDRLKSESSKEPIIID
jgi:predicted O-linked N-acetylglucosamine transferase (SPINDLY family)